jgi:hypothetical protein
MTGGRGWRVRRVEEGRGGSGLRTWTWRRRFGVARYLGNDPVGVSAFDVDPPDDRAARSTQKAAGAATGLTAYLKNGGTLENAALMANHASTRTTQLYV